MWSAGKCVRVPLYVCTSKCALSPTEMIGRELKMKAESEANYQKLPWAPAQCF